MNDDSDDSEVLEPTPLEHQDVYDVAHAHGWAGVPRSDSATILMLAFGLLDEGREWVARAGYECGAAEAAEHTASLRRPLPADARIPF